MANPSRHSVLAATLLAVAALFWLALLLFQFRIVNIFHAYLMKFPGPWVVFGAMFACPLFAMILGVMMIRNGRARVLGGVTALAGGLLVVAFLAAIGVPLLVHAMKPETPKNPSTPRAVGPQEGLPVFPGAEGFGTRTRAGRGGKLIEVTSLADDGPGTLRAAIGDPSPRTIVFRVAGTIELDSELQIAYPFVTIAGQTAPGDGICIKNAGIAIMTHDVLIQHLRIRPGNEGPVDADVNDAVSILGRHGDVDGAWNVVLDHVSASWAEDETVSTWYGAHDITISWSIISEALNRSRHRKKTHSAGLLVGDGSCHVSVHHTLLAHNDFRNPLVIGGGTHEFVNNVIYDWGVLPAEIVDEDSNSFVNFIGNFFLPGPSTQPGPYEILIQPTTSRPKIYVEGNLGPHCPESETNPWAMVGYGYGEQGVAPEAYRSATRFATHPVRPSDALKALEEVLANAGATAPQHDAVDRRVIAEVRSGTGRIIDSPREVGGYPDLSGGTPPLDSDHDGMPDAWEDEMGLDARDASDGSGDLDGDGYTNLEEYLHSLSGINSGSPRSFPTPDAE